MPTPILTTKLSIPPLRPHIVSRSRLIERLNEGLHRKLTLVSAPAGFGKTTLYEEGVQTLVLGDVRDIRQNLEAGSNNQRLHQWSFGHARHLLTYKAERMGMQVVLHEERHTSKTCPIYGQRKKSSPKGRNSVCKTCGYRAHRDGVGAMNIRFKYRGKTSIRNEVTNIQALSGGRY